MLSFMLFFILSRLCNSNKDEVLLLCNITKKHRKWTINRQSIQKLGVVFDKSRQHWFSESPRINWRLRFKSDYKAAPGDYEGDTVLMIIIIIYFLSIGILHKDEDAILYKIAIDKFFEIK